MPVGEVLEGNPSREPESDTGDAALDTLARSLNESRQRKEKSYAGALRLFGQYQRMVRQQTEWQAKIRKAEHEESLQEIERLIEFRGTTEAAGERLLDALGTLLSRETHDSG